MRPGERAFQGSCDSWEIVTLGGGASVSRACVRQGGTGAIQHFAELVPVCAS